MAFGGIYDTGAISVANGATSVTGVGTLWSVVVEEGDFLIAGGLIGYINTVTDDDSIVLAKAWPGSTLSGASYVIVKTSFLRYDPALTQAKLRLLLEGLTTQTIIYNVVGSAPDPALGEEGQFAVKVNTGSWKIWLKTGGVWVVQGTPVGIADPVPYSSGSTYVVNASVTYGGGLYVSLQAGNINHQPDISPSWWIQIASGFTFIGNYSAGTAYGVGHSTLYDGSLWIAVAPSTGVTPGTDVTKWRKGAQGISDANVTAAAASQAAAAASASAAAASATGATASQSAAATSATTSAASASAAAASATIAANSATASAISATASDVAKTTAIVQAALAATAATNAATSAVASQVSADDAADIVATLGDEVTDAQAAAAAAAGSAAAAQGYADILANPDYGFFTAAPTDFRDYGSTWI